MIKDKLNELVRFLPANFISTVMYLEGQWKTVHSVQLFAIKNQETKRWSPDLCLLLLLLMVFQDKTKAGNGIIL